MPQFRDMGVIRLGGRSAIFRYSHKSGQSLPDLVWWHDESFKGRHDSFCTMNTGAASVFLQSLAAYFWSPPNDGFEAV